MARVYVGRPDAADFWFAVVLVLFGVICLAASRSLYGIGKKYQDIVRRM